MDEQLHSAQRRLMEMRMARGDRGAVNNRLAGQSPTDARAGQRLKQRCLAVRRQGAATEHDDLA